MPIPPGSTITAATLAFTTSAAQTSPGAASNLAGVHQVDAAPALASSQQTTDWTPTAAWSPTGPGAKSVDLTAAVQALVDRPGWTDGNPVVVRVQGNTTGTSGSANLTDVTLTVTHEPPLISGDLTTAVPGPPVMDWTGTSVNPAALDTTVAGPVAADWSGTSINPATLNATVPGPPALDWAGQSVNPAVLDAVVSGPPVVVWTGTQAGSILHAEVPGPPVIGWAGLSVNPATLDAVVPGLVASIDGQSINPGTLTAATPGPPDAGMPGTSINPAVLDATAPGPVTIAAAGTVTNPATLDAGLPGPPVIAVAGTATNPAVLAAEVPGPPEADMSGVIFGVIALRRPPRPLEQLLRDGTRRRDLIRIQTGEHTGLELPVTSWSLTLDHLSTIRATGSAEVRHTPKLAALLDPRARTELAMILAIEDDEGEIHEWQKALLHTVPLERGHHMSIQLEDRAAWVRAAGMRTRIVMPAGMDIVQAATLLLGARAPWLPVAIPLSGTVLPQDAVLGGLGADPWEIASELVRSIGHRLHIDPYGIAKTAPITDLLTATPVAEWADDAADITDLQTTISDTDVVNVVGLPWTTQPGEGEPPDAITGGTEWWIDTTSSVSVSVRGDRVQPYPGDTSLIASAAQARDAAAAHGLTAQGIAISVDIPGVRFDPRRDVGDIIRVRGQRLGLDLVTRLTGLTYTAGAPTMGVTLVDRRML